jgi:NitT/TauT family transport system substrate-binding protein
MSGQVDVGWSVVPVNLDLVAKKQLKIIGHGSDAKALASQTVRVNIANTKWLDAHRDVAVRFWRAYAASIEWMYKNPNISLANLAKYNSISVDEAKAVLPFYPQKALAIYPVASFEKSVSDAVSFKFITAPLTPEQQKAIFDIVFVK